MRTGDADGLDVVYDDEAQLILSERERLYGRRGLNVEALETARLTKKSLFEESLWMVFFTNQRVVGLRDKTGVVEQRNLGTLRPIERTRLTGPQAETPNVLRYFEFPTKDILGVGSHRRKYLWIRARAEDETYEFRFRPWGGASRFFSNLSRKRRS